MDILDFLEDQGPANCQTCGEKLTCRIGKKHCSDQGRAMIQHLRKTKEERWI